MVLERGEACDDLYRARGRLERGKRSPPSASGTTSRIMPRIPLKGSALRLIDVAQILVDLCRRHSLAV
jgi:hypothetical protein